MDFLPPLSIFIQLQLSCFSSLMRSAGGGFHHITSYLPFGKLAIHHYTFLWESLRPGCFFSQVEGQVGLKMMIF